MRLLLALVLICFAQTIFAQPFLEVNFQNDEVGKFPAGWRSRDNEDSVLVYSVQAAGERRFLHADARALSVQISYEKKWSLRDFPILRWQWRADTFPTGSNERVKGGNDSVLGLYVVLSGLPFVTAIKYIWSDTLPAGTVLDSPYSGGTKMIVLRSGRDLVGTWLTEERDVLSDYERVFGKKEKNPKAIGIAILTDADNTNSRSVGDYADITILARGAP